MNRAASHLASIKELLRAAERGRFLLTERGQGKEISSKEWIVSDFGHPVLGDERGLWALPHWC